MGLKIDLVGNVSIHFKQTSSSLVVSQLGWVDFIFRCSTILLGQEVATVAAHQPREHLKSKSTQPNSETTRIILC